MTSAAYTTSPALRVISNLQILAENSIDIPFDGQGTINALIANVTQWLPEVSQVTERASVFQIIEKLTKASANLMKVSFRTQPL